MTSVEAVEHQLLLYSPGGGYICTVTPAIFSKAEGVYTPQTQRSTSWYML